MESGDPTLQPAVVGIDVLDMPGTALALAAKGVQRVVLKTKSLCRTGQHGAAVGAEHRIRSNGDRQDRQQPLLVAGAQEVIGHLTRPVAGDQNRYLFVRQTPLRRRTAPTARFAAMSMDLQISALALERPQEVGLVGLYDAAQVLILRLAGDRQESMPPAKSRGPVHAQTCGGLADAQAGVHDLGLLQPTVSVAKPRQGRAGQWIEGLPTVPAAKPLGAATLAMPHQMPAGAVRARRRDTLRNQPGNQPLGSLTLQLRQDFLLLGRRQSFSLRQPTLQFSSTHPASPRPKSSGRF